MVRMKPRTAALFVAATVAGMATLVCRVPAEEKPDASNDLAARVEKRIQEWQPTAAERRFDEIGWAKDIRDAEKLAKEHGRPVFLFTHDGRMAIGRC